MIAKSYTQSSVRRLSDALLGGFFLEKLPKTVAMLALTGLGVGIAYLGGLQGVTLMIVACLGAPVVFTIIWRTEIGIYLLVTASFFLSIALRLIPQVPMGLSIDLLILMMIVGKTYKLQFDRDWSPMKSPLTVILLVWVCYNLAQIANPWAASRAAFFYVIRPAVGYLMLYFLIWDTMKSRKSIEQLFDYILFLGFIAATWGIYQFKFGYFQWEMNFILRNDTVHLVFNDGRWRSFGPIGSPSQYGIVMAVLASISINSFFYAKRWGKKVRLLIVFGACLLAMVYSGTRAAYVIPPIFYFTKVLISRNRQLYFSLVFAFLWLIALANIPTNNYQIQRIQSIFRASEDRSFQTRSANRKLITPYIIKHPIGGGLGSTGTWGQRFSPGTFLANFPPDSGIIRVAVELGWIGLGIFLALYATAFIRGVRGFWAMPTTRSRDKVEGILCILPALAVVEMGQEVVGVFPMSLLFWVLLAILFTTLRFENDEA